VWLEKTRVKQVLRSGEVPYLQPHLAFFAPIIRYLFSHCGSSFWVRLEPKVKRKLEFMLVPLLLEHLFPLVGSSLWL